MTYLDRTIYVRQRNNGGYCMNQWAEVRMCTTCTVFVANGEWPDNYSHDDIVEHKGRMYDAGDIVVGYDHHDCTHSDSEDCPMEEVSFSWSACDICGDPLGGDRHIGYVRHTNE